VRADALWETCSARLYHSSTPACRRGRLAHFAVFLRVGKLSCCFVCIWLGVRGPAVPARAAALKPYPAPLSGLSLRASPPRRRAISRVYVPLFARLRLSASYPVAHNTSRSNSQITW
jgi:hypothetical protein